MAVVEANTYLTVLLFKINVMKLIFIDYEHLARNNPYSFSTNLR